MKRWKKIEKTQKTFAFHCIERMGKNALIQKVFRKLENFMDFEICSWFWKVHKIGKQFIIFSKKLSNLKKLHDLKKSSWVLKWSSLVWKKFIDLDQKVHGFEKSSSILKKNHIFEKASGFWTIILGFGKFSSFFEKEFMDFKKVHRF